MEHIACTVCGLDHRFDENQVPEGFAAHCERCGTPLRHKTTASLAFTAAFALAALLLYGPANLFPILRMNAHGAISENTVWQGTMRFYEDGDYFIALLIFLASFLIPLLKILGLLFLTASTHFGFTRMRNARTHAFIMIDKIGKWAMLDVFVVAILVSLVKLQRIATVVPGKGLLAFGSVVAFTLLASASFDSQLIWSHERSST